MEWLRSIKLMWDNMRKSDPVYSCQVYKDIGCSHVDGYLCDMETCNILKEYIPPPK